MQDGSTRRVERSEVEQAMFLARHEATLVVLQGAAIGTEYTLESASQTMGRGPGVDIAIADDAMSREHAVIELGSEGFRVRDLDSTNGLVVNDRPVASADLQNGDRISLGEHTVQFVLDTVGHVETFEISDH
jgi:pSer/pThr/pTyr-binding forkhead associated (FHA) protein